MYKVLLVDDEILVRTAMRENMNWTSMGYELIGDCANGKEAMEFVKKNPVDVVVTDICMPFVDGMELSQWLYNNYPDIVIIIFSGFEEFEYAKKAIQYHVSEYLLKPITATELSEVLEKIKTKLESRRTTEEHIESLTAASKEYKKNKNIIRSQAISHLVMHTKNIEDSLQEVESMGIQLDAEEYRAAVVDIDLYSEPGKVTLEEKQESALMAFVVYNISQELMEQYEAGIAYQERGHRVGLLLMTNRPNEFLGTVDKLVREIQEKVDETMGLQVSIGVGTYVKDVKNLYQSYESAVQALEYRYTLGESLILDMETEKDSLGKGINIDQYLSDVQNAVKLGQEEEVSQMFYNLEGEMVQAKTDRARTILYLQQLAQGLEEVVSQIIPEQGKTSEENEAFLTKIAETPSLLDASQIVKEEANRIIHLFDDANSSNSKRQARMALEYIEQNYGDAELSLNGICSYLSISTSYFSTIFKESTGETFMEVLIRTRMEKAKELLTHTTLKNYEIAEKVGFSDPHYFSIAFKKMTGKTPKEFAKEKRMTNGK